MNTKVKSDIVIHAQACPTEEICGLIYYTNDSVHAYPCANISSDNKADSFEISPSDYVAARQLGEICGVYHGGMTHSNPGFSEEDIACANEIGLPFYAFCGSEKSFAHFIPTTYRVPLTGLPFIWGQWDCYETIRTYYRQERGIDMGDYDRDGFFVNAPDDAITRYIEAEGFAILGSSNPIIKGDVLLFRTLGRPHHLAVITGPNQFLHHPLNSLSRIDSLDKTSMRKLVSVMRYKS